MNYVGYGTTSKLKDDSWIITDAFACGQTCVIAIADSENIDKEKLGIKTDNVEPKNKPELARMVSRVLALSRSLSVLDEYCLNEAQILKDITTKKFEDIGVDKYIKFINTQTESSSELNRFYKDLWLNIQAATRSYSLCGDTMEGLYVKDKFLVFDGVGSGYDPFYQLNAIECLEKAFPNFHIIAFTNSPIVVSTAKNGSVLVYENGTFIHPPIDTFNQNLNKVTEACFGVGTRDPEIMSLVEQIKFDVNNKNVDAAKSNLEQLKSRLGDNDLVDMVRFSVEDLAYSKVEKEAETKNNPMGDAAGLLGGMLGGMGGMDIPEDIPSDTEEVVDGTVVEEQSDEPVEVEAEIIEE